MFKESAKDIGDTSPCTQKQLSQVKTKVKKVISDEFNSYWCEHVKSLAVQGRFLELLNLEKNNLTWRSISYNLPRNVLKFAVNASIDTLATNANLKRWGKRTNARCSLCKGKETLHHALNYCSIMLPRYTWRHNSVLKYIYEILEMCECTYDINVDLPGLSKGVSTLPTDILITNQRPDIFLVNRNDKTCIIAELTICFETNIQAAHERKQGKYAPLSLDLENRDYKVHMYTIEIGSRGFIDKCNEGKLKSFFRKATRSPPKWSDMKKNFI